LGAARRQVEDDAKEHFVFFGKEAQLAGRRDDGHGLSDGQLVLRTPPFHVREDVGHHVEEDLDQGLGPGDLDPDLARPREGAEGGQEVRPQVVLELDPGQGVPGVDGVAAEPQVLGEQGLLLAVRRLGDDLSDDRAVGQAGVSGAVDQVSQDPLGDAPLAHGEELGRQRARGAVQGDEVAQLDGELEQEQLDAARDAGGGLAEKGRARPQDFQRAPRRRRVFWKDSKCFKVRQSASSAQSSNRQQIFLPRSFSSRVRALVQVFGNKQSRRRTVRPGFPDTYLGVQGIGLDPIPHRLSSLSVPADRREESVVRRPREAARGAGAAGEGSRPAVEGVNPARDGPIDRLRPSEEPESGPSSVDQGMASSIRRPAAWPVPTYPMRSLRVLIKRSRSVSEMIAPNQSPRDARDVEGFSANLNL
jgi:hypothetical protein